MILWPLQAMIVWWEAETMYSMAAKATISPTGGTGSNLLLWEKGDEGQGQPQSIPSPTSIRTGDRIDLWLTCCGAARSQRRKSANNLSASVTTGSNGRAMNLGDPRPVVVR